MWFGFSAGTAIPVGGFADVSRTNAGCGNTGFSFGVEATNDISGNIDWYTSLNLNLNRTKRDPLVYKLNTSNTNCGEYVTTNLLTGPCIWIASISSANFILSAQAGVQLLFTPAIDFTYGDKPASTGSDLGTGFVYCLGLTVNISNANLSLRYCKARPEVVEHYHYSGVSNTISKTTQITTDMVQIMVGVNI